MCTYHREKDKSMCPHHNGQQEECVNGKGGTSRGMLCH